jgi:conjugative transfer signal peptidase TraF
MTEPIMTAARRLGTQLRAARTRRQSMMRSSLAVAGLVAAIGATVAMPPAPRLVWNVSASAPVGLYAVTSRGELEAGDMVIARVPEPWRIFAARRHYIPANVPLVKRVAAMPGDRVCAIGESIFVNGRPVATRHVLDGAGRAMPWWQDCITLRDGSLLLLMERPDSFDGRYFGPSRRGHIVGKARLLWRR